MKLFGRRTEDREKAERRPPGQVLTEKWPVLHYGGVPKVPKEKWSLRVFGLIEGEPVSINFEQLLALPQADMTEDIHCVTRWSRLSVPFQGVLFSEILKLVK